MSAFPLRISGFRLENWGPFLDSGWVELNSGLTFIIGKNNSGKSWALRGLSGRDAESHLSPAGNPVPTPPTLTLRCKADSAAALQLLNEAGGIWIPRPTEIRSADAAALFREHLERHGFVLERRYPNGNTSSDYYAAHVPYSALPQWCYFHPDLGQTPATTKAMEVLNKASDQERYTVQLFDPRRTDFSQCVDSGAKEIGIGGESLATAIAKRLGNHLKYAEFMNLVRRVIPDLRHVTAETGNNQARLLSWLEDPGLGSGETKIELSKCGAGVGHVLALVYLAFYERNRTLLLDEPQAYLHPSACRELVRVFQDLKDNGHRIVIATHSTAMLAEAMPVNVIEVQREEGHSVFKPKQAADFREALASLATVGARWSDVFGPDRLVWVEGETEAACYPILFQTLRSQRGITFVPLHATGDLVGKKAEKAKFAFNSYSKVTANLSLAGRCLIVLDRETLSAETRNAIIAQFPKGTLVFTTDQMFEDLLLDAEAISKRLCTLLEGMEQAPPIESIPRQVEKALNSRTKDDSAATVLKNLYDTISEQRIEYRKVEEGIELTRLILRSTPEKFTPLVVWLEEQLKKSQ